MTTDLMLDLDVVPRLRGFFKDDEVRLEAGGVVQRGNMEIEAAGVSGGFLQDGVSALGAEAVLDGVAVVGLLRVKAQFAGQADGVGGDRDGGSVAGSGDFLALAAGADDGEFGRLDDFKPHRAAHATAGDFGEGIGHRQVNIRRG